jgi:hypothetical protein
VFVAGGIAGLHDGVLGKIPVFPEYIPVRNRKYRWITT